MLQVCTKIHRPVCSPVTKQHCSTAQQEPVCETVYEEVCSSVPEQSCDTGIALELKTNILRRFTTISQSRNQPFASASQFHGTSTYCGVNACLA